MSMHFLGYQGSCNKNTSKYVSAFCWYKVVSMVWLSLCIPIRNKGVIFPPRKEKTYSESLARGWVSLLRCSSPVMINDKPLCSLESPPHTPRARSKGGHILPSSLTPAWRPRTAPRAHKWNYAGIELNVKSKCDFEILMAVFIGRAKILAVELMLRHLASS